MTIVFYEPQCRGIEHLKFISTTIRCIKNIYPDAEYKLICEEELCNNLLKINDFLDTKTFRFPMPTKSKIKNVKGMYQFEIQNIKEINKYNPDKIICLSASIFTILFFSIFERNKPVYVFFHGILELLNHKYKITNLMYWFKIVLKHESKNIKNIVLGDVIRKNFLTIIPKLSNSTFSVDLVYPSRINRIYPLNKKIKFAGIGFGNREKGSDFIFEIAESIKEKADFIHIGKMDKSLIPLETNVKILGKDKPLDTEAFEKTVDTIDFGLFFYDSSKYKLTASGAIFDALTHGKPVICLKNAYFEYVFNKLGDIGYLCETREEVINVIKEIIEKHDEKKYTEQQKTIVANIWKFSEDEILKQLSNILEK